MKLHFISIGGAAMHNLAIALKMKGFTITGSDDEVFEPSRSRLNNHGLLPKEMGWKPSRITSDLDGVILGMHALMDNPELIKAKELGLKIYSFPEYLYEQTKNKKRVVIAGSHGKTTITAMVIHVLKYCGKRFDFMVGSQIEGFDAMVSLDSDNSLAIFEGDEYLSSPLDLRPKFTHYRPHIALVSGIAWDHINVFPTFEEYVSQFQNLGNMIERDGHFVYFSGDQILCSIAANLRADIQPHPYKEHGNYIKNDSTFLSRDLGDDVAIELFGSHNLENLNGARCICNLLQIEDEEFYEAIASFKGTKKRLQALKKTNDSVVFLDFAHSPSKVKATVRAVREQYPDKRLVAVFELHTFSSLSKNFIPEYSGALDDADEAVIYLNHSVIAHKKLEEISEDYIKKCFTNDKIIVFSDTEQLTSYVTQCELKNTVLLLMSSGNFGGIALEELIGSL